MSKHTPGPWYQCGDEVLIDMGDRSHLVATVADWSEDTEPYARLIAAAPEMYAELKRLCDSFGWPADHPACIATAKAEGK